MIASVVSSCISYSNAKKNIADDLNEAMIALVNENKELWTCQDTIAALRYMHAITNKPLIYQASDIDFRNSALKNETYYTLALVDKKAVVPKIRTNKIVSDSIMLVPESTPDGLAIRVQGFADCSMASVFAVSDRTLPGIFFALSIFSMAGMLLLRKMVSNSPSLDGIKLTPMQRQLTQMLLDAPDNKVDKSTLCSALWGNKSNAEESLYTLVRRTKTALAGKDIDIICNRGDSYELRINN